MHARTTTKYLLYLPALLLLVACGGSGEDTGTDIAGTDTLKSEARPSGNGILNMGGKVFAIPSPVQVAMVLRKSGAKYQKELPLATDAAGKAVDKRSQALLMGVYGADLGYVTIFSDASKAMSTMQAIEKLSSALNMGNAFDPALVDRFKRNLGSEDSLLRLSGSAFRAADAYLKNDERNDISAMVMAGGWVEALYLAVSSPAAATDKELMNRIGEQRSTVGNLVGLLMASVPDAGNDPLVLQLNSVLNTVESTYAFKKPVTDASARTTFINSTSTVTLSAEQLKAITDKVTAIRKMITA